MIGLRVSRTVSIVSEDTVCEYLMPLVRKVEIRLMLQGGDGFLYS
jgi:hypothetical protein